MVGNVAGVVIFLAVCGIVTGSPERAIDCRKFVFAPLCRGVAAKRTGLGNEYSNEPRYADEKSFRDLLRNIYLAVQKAEEEDDHGGKSTNKQENAENSIRKYQQDRDNLFLRLLMGNRVHSEADNKLVQEFENL